MELSRSGPSLRGFYRYDRQPDVLTLTGTTGASGEIRLIEKDPRGKTTGKISGEAQNGCIKGEWSSPNAAKRVPLNVCQLSKRQALTAAIGTFYLASASGMTGANGMYDIVRSGRHWSVAGSAISRGRREVMEFGLEKPDLEVLNSLSVRVDDDLSVRFAAGDKTIRRIPFVENGMEHTLTTDDSSLWYFETLGKLSATTIFIHDRLFLAAIHEVDYSGLVDSDYFPTGPGRLIVTYRTGLERFEIQMGQATLILTRR
jgi:hypothetical protein